MSKKIETTKEIPKSVLQTKILVGHPDKCAVMWPLDFRGKHIYVSSASVGSSYFNVFIIVFYPKLQYEYTRADGTGRARAGTTLARA